MKKTAQRPREGKVALYRVSGLDCYSCGLSLVRSIKQKDGVKDAMLNFFTEQIRIEYDGSESTLKEIEEEIEESGYRSISRRRTT